MVRRVEYFPDGNIVYIFGKVTVIINTEEIRILRRDLLGKLSERETESILEQINLSFIPREGLLYVLEPIEHVIVGEDAVRLALRLTSNRAALGSNKIFTLGDLVSFFGGIENLSSSLKSIMEKPSLKKHGHLMYDYFSALDDVIKFACEITRQKQNYSFFPMVDHCALCWKSIEQSHYYCQDHHPESAPKEHRRAKRKLISAIKAGNDELADEIIKLEKEPFLGFATGEWMYRWVDHFSPDPFNLRNHIDLNSLEGFEALLKHVFLFCKDNYPSVFERIHSLHRENFKSFEDFCIKTVFELCPIESRAIEAYPEKFGLSGNTGKYDSPFNANLSIHSTLPILSMFRRYQAYSVINSTPIKRGPKKGQPYSPELRDLVLEKIQEYERKGEKRYGAKLAREFGMSRAYSNKLIREVKSLG